MREKQNIAVIRSMKALSAEQYMAFQEEIASLQVQIRELEEENNNLKPKVNIAKPAFKKPNTRADMMKFHFNRSFPASRGNASDRRSISPKYENIYNHLSNSQPPRSAQNYRRN